MKESVKVAKQTVSAFEAICTEGSDAKIHVVRGRRGRGAAEAKNFHYYGGWAVVDGLTGSQRVGVGFILGNSSMVLRLGL